MELLVPSLHRIIALMTKERPKNSPGESVPWSCHVEILRFRRPASAVARTVFAVKQQSFILAEGDGCSPEDVQHCEFIRDMFIKALSRIEVPLPQTPVRTESKPSSLYSERSGRRAQARKRKRRVSARAEGAEPVVCEHGTKGCEGKGEKHWCAADVLPWHKKLAQGTEGMS